METPTVAAYTNSKLIPFFIRLADIMLTKKFVAPELPPIAKEGIETLAMNRWEKALVTNIIDCQQRKLLETNHGIQHSLYCEIARSEGLLLKSAKKRFLKLPKTFVISFHSNSTIELQPSDTCTDPEFMFLQYNIPASRHLIANFNKLKPQGEPIAASASHT